MDINVYTMYTHGMRTTVSKWGNSLAIRIPKSFAVHLGIDSGEEVELSMRDDGLHIQPPKETLDVLLAKIMPEQLHGEFDTSPVGKEIW